MTYTAKREDLMASANELFEVVLSGAVKIEINQTYPLKESGAPGAYAEERVMPAHIAVKLPEGVDDQTAAAAMLKGMTAQFLIRQCFRVEPGMTVLLHAAAGMTRSSALPTWPSAIALPMPTCRQGLTPKNGSCRRVSPLN